MKRKITKFLAAFALLVFMTPSMVAWGQNNYVVEFNSTDGGDGTSEITSLSDIVASGADYITSISDASKVYKGKQGFGVKLGSSKAVGTFTMNLSEDGQVEATSIVFNSCYYGSDNSSLKITINGSITQTFTLTADLTDYTYTFSNATEITSIKIEGVDKRIYVKSMTVNYGGTPTPTCATPTFNPAAGTYTQAQTVTISCATEGATIYYTTDGNDPTTSSSEYSTPLTISQTTTVKAIAVKDGFDDSSIASATYTIAQSVSGYTIDFEQPASLYTDWTFTTITSEVAGTTDVPAHGGLHYGSTDGKTTGTIVTKTAIATPNTLTCYLSKASNNTTSSTWYVEVSSNGTDWTQAGTHSATSMSKGEWVEFTTNLSNYSNVYVRIRYAGTTAVRCIDDVVLNTEAPAIATPVISPESCTFETTQEVTITCATEGATIYYTTNGDDPTNLSSEYTGAFTLTETATVKAIAYNGTVYSTIASATYTKLVINNIEDITSADSYTVKGKIFAKSNKGFVLGDGTGFVYVYKTTNDFNVGDFVKVTGDVTDQYNGIYEFPSSSTITSVDAFDIAAATPTVMTGNAFTTFVNYEGAKLSSYVQYEGVLNISTSGNNTYYNLTIEGTDVQGSISYPSQNLTSFDDKAVRVTGYYVGKSGSTTTYFNTMLESISTTEPSITVDPILVNATIEGGSGTLMVTYENIATINANVFFCDEEGEAATYDWVSATINTSNNVEYTINANEGAARTAYMKVYVGETYSSLITINQAGLVAIDLRGVTTSLTFNAGDFTSSGSGYKDYDDVTYTGSNNVEYGGWTLRKVMHSDSYMQMQANTGKVYMPTILTDNGFTISVNAVTNSVSVGVGEESGENEFTTTATSADVVISAGSKYAVISTITITPTQAPTPGYTYTVNGYGNSDGGYVLMATPTAASVDPATVGMITDQLGANVTPETSTYDLYSYDQAQDKEWRNYRVAQNFELEPGKGYLYASKDGVTLTFTGDLNPAFDDVALPYTEGNAIKSLYLAGNSSTEAQTFYVYDYDNDLELQTVNFLTMNGTGDGFTTTVATSLTAQPMQGFFVQSAGSNWLLSTEDLSDGTNNNQGVSLLNINVMRDRGNVIDNAIVSFSEGSMMNKFYLKDNTTRVYIPQGNEEMAVVRSAAEAEMPVSFKASENGTYTLAIETENVEMNYLHLIDNLTGMDVDLLQTPSYTFEAKTNDYTSRFRLVFKASSTSSEADETFAYYDGSNWTVSNLGEATLQVVDVTGRTVSSETINGNATISLNQTPGVYMLRLVNGNSVKVQKVVVR